MACECRQETRRDKRRARCKDSTLGGAGGAPPSHMTNTRQLSIWLSINQGLPKQPSKKYTNVRIFQMHLTHRHTHTHTNVRLFHWLKVARTGPDRYDSSHFWCHASLSLSIQKFGKIASIHLDFDLRNLPRPEQKRTSLMARARTHTLTQNNNNDNN